MAFKFNILTGKLDLVESSGGITIQDAVKALLIDSDQATPYLPVASLMFDEDSVLYNDDEANV